MYLAVAAAFRKPDRLKIRPPFPPLAQRWTFTWLLSMATIQCSLFRRFGRTRHRLEYPLPDSLLTPAGEAVVDGLVRAVFLRAILPAAPGPKNMHNPAQNPSIILPLGSGLVGRQMRDNFRPLPVIEPKQIRIHGLGLQTG